MSEKGITSLVVVVAVVVVIAAVGVGYLLLLPGPVPGGPSNGQPSNGEAGETEIPTYTGETEIPTYTGETGIPTYTGATKFSIPSEMKSGLGITADATCQGYSTSADPEDVMDWYKTQMGGWTLMSENSISPPDQPGITVYMQHYKKDDNGAFIFATSNPQMGGTIFGIVTGSWSLIQGCGGFEGAPPEGDNHEGPPGGGGVPEGEDIDWTEAYVFTDPKGDFWFGEGSPPQVIEYPPSDIIKIYMTNDSQYLYFKFEMDGTIPTMPHAHNGDTVRILSMTCLIDSDQNKSTGEIMNYAGGDLAIEAWFGSPPEAGGVHYTFVHYAFYDPAGEEGTGEWTNVTILAGGVGENFVTMRFPLAALNLDIGMRVDILPWAEVESDLYHHFARDVYPAEGQWTTNIEIR